jgi:hypothetical protein
MASKLPTIGPFPAGVNNRRDDHELRQPVQGGSIDLLRSATNVDLTDEGKVRRRPGFTQAIAQDGCHSLWGDGNTGFYAAGSGLHQLRESGPGVAASLVRDDLAPGQPMSYCEAGGTYYYTGSGHIGMVRDGVRIDFTPRLNVTPVLSAIPGALSAGRYQFCFTQMGIAGESAATVPQVIDLPTGGGIRISSIPPAASGTTLRAYMTAANGEVFGRVDLQVNAGVAEIVAPPELGARCQTLLLEPMPAGSIVRHSNGRLLVAVGNLLCYSEPFANGLFRPSKNYIPFAAPVSVVEPCGSGVFVVADKTYWFDGDLATASMVEKLPYGAVPHSGGSGPTDSNTVFWISTRGLVFGGADGSVRNAQEKQLALAGGAAGATLYREQEGMTHILTAVRDPMQTTAAASSYFDAEIVRKGVVL